MELTESSDVNKQHNSGNQSSSSSVTIYFLIASLLIVLDQLTKVLVKGFSLFGYHHDGMWLGQSYPLIGDLVRITFVENPGMAFGIQFGFWKVFLTLFSLIAGSALIWYLSKLGGFKTSVKIGITLLIAGALGNFIDRCFYGVLYGEQNLFYGYVVDFIQVDIPDIDWFGATYTHWPVFNIADSCVSCGMVLLLIVNKHIPSLSHVRGNFESETLSDSSQGGNVDDTIVSDDNSELRKESDSTDMSEKE